MTRKRKRTLGGLLSAAPLAVIFDRAEADAVGWPYLERYFCAGVLVGEESFVAPFMLGPFHATAASAERERTESHTGFPRATVQRAFLLFDPRDPLAMTLYDELRAELAAPETLQ